MKLTYKSFLENGTVSQIKLAGYGRRHCHAISLYCQASNNEELELAGEMEGREQAKIIQSTAVFVPVLSIDDKCGACNAVAGEIELGLLRALCSAARVYLCLSINWMICLQGYYMLINNTGWKRWTINDSVCLGEQLLQTP
ncbi:uncharacterized protein LOC120262974 [Dioscorea cayenensis subsp. rotundata]|uniref:Uncharacterized protein LOC120262974 n=1 Tax=Dioscorea cayennensis subsp. rotundata TaxID=55577 RepID=A0AB40BHK4_DIOCR|nr:uncharacterized protein LOC120262974 [Dioscorea cayenensis subsp. rotundata]XP_039126832.1 uncharacterized protein LOC120262974 [Dioscorea cayenensis subsp. rotundata]XP_039126833.1 uncharacterized protein LOC120262974 [Dioscorea cayenensis subsp. rotundata]